MQDDMFNFENPPNNFDFEQPNDIDYEKISYGKSAYRRVQRLRKKGERRGIAVPKLNYELTKPENPRIAFWVVAGLSALLFVAIIVGFGFLYNELIITFSDLSGMGEFFKIVFDPALFAASFGLSAIPGILLVLVYLLIAVLFALPIIAVIYFYRFVRDAFYMANCSKEEFAKGGIISSRITGLITVIVVATVIFIILLSYVTAESAKLYMGLIFGGLIIALGVLLVLMTVEKIKCNKWFSDLDEDKKQNYLEHENALKRVKRRMNMEKQMWNH